MIKFRLLTLIILCLIISTDTGGAVIEVRGAAAKEAATWDASSFAGFWYDIETDKSTESLVVRGSLGYDRTIQSGDLLYYTSDVAAPYRIYSARELTVDGQTSYNVVGWMGEKYVAVNGKANKLSKLILEQDNQDSKVLAVGETWDMGDGYTLTANSIDAKASPGQVWFTLSKDGVKKDDKVALQGQSYIFRETNLAGAPNVPVFVTYINKIYPGTTTDMVELKYSWLISKSITSIQSGDKYGLLKVSMANENNIILANEQSIALQKGSRIDLFGNIKLYVADSELFIYCPVRIEASDKYSIRGETAKGATSWNARNFAGFWYDLNSDQSTESLTLGSINIAGRYIEANGLTYKTSPVSLKYMVTAQKGIPVNNMNYYSVVGWNGDKYLAINGKANKLLRIIRELGTSASDKKTLTVGETWDMGEGWTLTANSIDARASPRQVWLTLSKDGVKKDDKVLTSGTEVASPLYTYVERNLGGETDVTVFAVYIDSVFAGATTDMVQLRFAFLVSNSPGSIKVGDRFGVFQVTTSNDNSIVLTNKDRISLSPGNVVLMDNMKFKVANDPSNLRFYPVVEKDAQRVFSISGAAYSNTPSIISSTYTPQYTYISTAQPSNNQSTGYAVILVILIIIYFIYFFGHKKSSPEVEKKVEKKPVKPDKKETKVDKKVNPEKESTPKEMENTYTLIMELRNISDKIPIKRATVILDHPGGEVFERTSDIDGKAIFGKLKEGVYRARIVSRGFEEYFRELDVNKNDRMIIELRGKATLCVSVYDIVNGRPLAGAKIKIGDMELTTDERGNSVIQDITFGSHTLSVSKDSYKTEELSLDVKDITLNRKIELNPETKFDDELTVIGEGLRRSFNDAMKKLSSSCDMSIPEYYRSICSEIIRVIETIAATHAYAESDQSRENIYSLYSVAERICKEMELILTNEENINEYISMESRGYRTTIDTKINIAEYDQIIHQFMTDIEGFTGKNENHILKKLQIVDQEITDNIQKYNVSPVANLWNISQKVIRTDTKDISKHAASLLLGNMLIDKTGEMLKNEEIRKRLRK
ncbi:MAG: hypothetical protein KKA10_11765 [Euryarchaeota archaeon]|nr:hypothetical protein [Euryarchaeota archaeon]MCG2736047.1 hypothetical protein [Candidatus Methanoperedenaceae archaeon]